MEIERREVLIVSPRTVSAQLDPGLRLEGWNMLRASDTRTARRVIEEHDVHVGLLVCNFRPGRRTDRFVEEVLHDLSQTATPTQWVALVPAPCKADPDIRRLIVERCFDFHTLPVDAHRLAITLGHAHGMALLSQAVSGRSGRKVMIGAVPGPWPQHRMAGTSQVMQELFRTIRKAASIDAPVLITGETGTGKELTARAIHRGSAHAQGPFIAVNCSALPANLIQAELFGYERGAFTGAQQRTPGRIELAAGGVLLLDEIGDLAPELQVNLLRFLEEGTLERVGGRTPIAVDTRVIAATHVDLERAVKQGRFREDLYHRINVLRVPVPPLRERGSDVIYLARLFLERYLPEVRRRGVRFTREAIDAMSRYPWPGNVRELTNRIHHAVAMCEGRWITPASLGLDQYVTESSPVTLTEARSQVEAESIRKALRDVGHNVSRAAHSLGVSRRTLYRRMKRYGISAGATDRHGSARVATDP